LNSENGGKTDGVKELIGAPLDASKVIQSIQELQETQNYLVIYIDTIQFAENILFGLPSKGKKQQITQRKTTEEENVLYHDTIPIGKTFYKVLRGKSTANKLLFCSFSDCLREFNETGNLKTHMRKHTGDRPFHCTFDDCGKSFITKGHL